MAALRKSHAQDGIAGFQNRKVRRHIGGGTRMGLDVDMLAPEQLLGTRNGQLFDRIHVLAAAVIAPPWIAFRVFVGHQRSLRGQDREARIIFGSDQHQLVALSFLFGAKSRVDLRIFLFDCFQGPDDVAHYSSWESGVSAGETASPVATSSSLASASAGASPPCLTRHTDIFATMSRCNLTPTVNAPNSFKGFAN